MPLMRLGLRRYPKMIAALARRHVMYNAQLRYVEAQEQSGDTLVLAPEMPLSISHTSHDPQEMHRIYEIGRRQCEANLAQITAFVGG